MATIFRGPIITAPFKRDSPAARHFVAAGLSLLTAVALPVGQAAGMELAKPKRDHNQERSYVWEGLSRRLQQTLPFNQADWPLPKPKKDHNQERQFVSAGLSCQLAVTLPFSQVDWPLPKIKDSPIARRWELQNDLSRQLQVALPFNKTDWPLPKRPIWMDRSWIETNDLARQLAVTLPFRLTEWPLPKRPVPPNVSWIETNDLAKQLAVTLPFSKTDWPLPARLPFHSLDMPLPNVAALNTVVVVVTAPFSQLDWPLPKAARATTPDEIPINYLPLTVVPTPPPPPPPEVRQGPAKDKKEPVRRRSPLDEAVLWQLVKEAARQNVEAIPPKAEEPTKADIVAVVINAPELDRLEAAGMERELLRARISALLTEQRINEILRMREDEDDEDAILALNL